MKKEVRINYAKNYIIADLLFYPVVCWVLPAKRQ